MIGFSAETARRIRALDEHWTDSGQPLRHDRHEEIPLLGRILGLPQTVEVFSRRARRPAVRTMAVAPARHLVRPDARRRAPRRSRRRPLLEWLAEGRVAELVLAAIAPDDIELGTDDARLDRIAEAFAAIVDAKSPYTARHSAGVAVHAGTHRTRARVRFSGAARSAAAAPFCTTSASSGSRTRSSTSRGSSTRRSSRGSRRIRSTPSRSWRASRRSRRSPPRRPRTTSA